MTIRGVIYSVLSECYKEPTRQFAEDVAEGRLHAAIYQGLKDLGIDIDISALKGEGEIKCLFKRLREDYHSLFFPLFVVPVESVYKEWAKGGGSPLPHSVKKGYIMGDPAVEMIKRYKMAGVETPKEFKDTPDHIALLLEYAALLCENVPEDSRAGYVLDHLDWVEDLRNDIYKYSRSDFYRCIADITVAFINNEISHVQRNTTLNVIARSNSDEAIH